MYNLHLSPEQLEFRDTIRDFANDEIKPVTLKADRLDAGDRRLPAEVLDKASQMGLRALALSEVDPRVRTTAVRTGCDWSVIVGTDCLAKDAAAAVLAEDVTAYVGLPGIQDLHNAQHQQAPSRCLQQGFVVAGGQSGLPA